MASFEEKTFNIADGLRDKTYYKSTPISEDDARDQIQGLLDELRDYINNTLVAGLNNAETTKSGAEKIGSAPISMVTGATVYDQIKNLKEQIDGVSQGAVTPGSITDEKLADDVKVGSLTSLTTTAKSSVVGAINELDAEIGDVSTLTTTATTLAGAINEIDGAMVDTDNIVDGAVKEGKLGTDAVTNTKIMNGQVFTEKLADGAVTKDKIGTDAIDGTKIANDAINSEHYADGSIDKAHLSADCVDGTKIANDAINSEHYVNSSIDGVHIANDAINSQHYANGSIDNAHLAADCVNGSKIANDSINSEHYVNYSIDAVHINTGAVTKVKLGSDVPTVTCGTSSTPSGGNLVTGSLYIKY